MDGTKRAAIYTRISKDREGTELGVDRQESLSRKLAEQNGYEVAAVFRENDVSASKLSSKPRPAFNEMMERAHSGGFEAIVAYSYSRLTRRPREFDDIIELAENRGVRIITVASGEFDLNLASGRGVARTIAAWDAVEAEQAGERIRAAKAQRAEQGLWHGGVAPYGYRAENKTLVPNAAEAALVDQAVRRLLSDREPLASIVKDWNNSGIQTRTGKHWRQTNLRSILMNRSLLGETKAGIRGWDPILMKRDFDRLNALFSDPSRKLTHSPGVKGGKYSMGGGLSVCGRCGKPLTSSLRSDGVSTLICNRQVQGPDPINHPPVDRVIMGELTKQDSGRVRIEHDGLEAWVFEQAIAQFSDSARWRQRMSEQDPDANSKIDQLESDRRALRDERERAQRGFVIGIMSEADAKREVNRIDTELRALESRINDMLGRPVLADVLAQGLDWKTWSPGRRRAFLRLLIDRVVVNEAPPGHGRNTFRKRDETDEEFAERMLRRRMDAVAGRVRIVWAWNA